MGSNFWDAVAAFAAVVALVGGGVSWWQAKASKTAKAEAERATDRSERQAVAAQEQALAAREQAAAVAVQVEQLEGMLIEAREQSNSLSQIAEATAPRPLEAVHVQGMLYRLRNNTGSEMVIDQVDNRAKFARLRGLEHGTVLPAGESVEFQAGGSGSAGVTTMLFIGMVGEDRPRSVELPPKPPKVR